MKFLICDEWKCIFTERSWRYLKEGNDDMKRCIRHGALICHEEHGRDKEEVRKRISKYDDSNGETEES